MNAAAETTAAARRWRLEFVCEGAPSVWVGKAATEGMAEVLARWELDLPDDARLIACLELPA